MSKISRRVMIVLVLSLVFVMIFAGCSKMKQDAVPGGKASAKVTNNGGLAVKQGDYLYYINGLTSTTDVKNEESNKFGNVLKGAIMRGKIDSKGNVTEIKRLVPLMAQSTMKNGGISVFGNWVYYTTPCTVKDKNGNMQLHLLDYMRTSIDGTKTELIARLGQVTDYKFTSSALIYVIEGKVYRVNYNDKKVEKPVDDAKKEGELVADDLMGAPIILKGDVYENGKTPIDDIMFYTKADSDAKATNNVVYAQKLAKDSKPVAIIKGDTYSEKFQITLKKCVVDGNSIKVYYEKSSSNPNNKAGIFMSVYKDGKLDTAKEVRLTDRSAVDFFEVGDDFLIKESSKFTFVTKKTIQGEGKDAIESFDYSKTIDLGTGEFVDFVDYKFYGQDKAQKAILYILNNVLYVRAINDEGLAIPATKVSNEEYSITTTWLGVEIIDGRAYFFNGAFYNHVDSVNIADGTMFKKDDKLTHPLAQLTEDEKEQEAKKAEAEKEDKK